MKRGIQLTILLGIALVLLSACTQQAAVGETSTQDAGTQETSSITPGSSGTSASSETLNPSASSSGTTVEITANGFNPSTLTIAKGTTVTFTNTDTNPHRVASNPHPVHTDYPTTGGCVGSTFDSCANIAPGESWSFTFDEVGTWGYHDHLNPGTTGTIIVE